MGSNISLMERAPASNVTNTVNSNAFKKLPMSMTGQSLERRKVPLMRGKYILSNIMRGSVVAGYTMTVWFHLEKVTP